MLDKLKRQAKIGKLMADKKAQGAMGSMAMTAVSLIVALTVGGIVAAFLLPVALNELVAVDTSSWSSGASSLWDILDVIVVLSAFLFFVGIALAAGNRV